MDYKQKVIEAYAGGGEVNRAEHAGEYGMEFIYTKKALDPYIGKDKRIIEIGCGGGYYGMHYGPLCMEYHGVDLSPVNVGIFRERIQKAGYENMQVHTGDATNLEQIGDKSYDVVLCLGPMYHLNREDRKKCISECHRICRTNGIVVFAFINKIGVIAKFAPVTGWDTVLTPGIEDCVLKRGTDNVHTDIFYYTLPEEMLQDTGERGLSKIRMTGVDFLVEDCAIEEFTEEQRRIWFYYADIVAGSEYATALSNHALLICRKEEIE